MKSKKQWEPETEYGWSMPGTDQYGINYGVVVSPWRPSQKWNKYRAVRVIRERDYQRLLKMARRKNGR